MKTIWSIFFVNCILLGFNSAVVIGRCETISPESVYKEIQSNVQKKDWGAVYDGFDVESQKIIDSLHSYATWSTFGDGGAPADFNKLSGREKYIKISETNDRYAEGRDSGFFIASPLNEIIKVDLKGNEAEFTIKDNYGDEHKIFMRLINGVWKLHISDDSAMYKMAKAKESGDPEKAKEVFEELAQQRPSSNRISKEIEDSVARAGNSKEEQLFVAIEAAYEFGNVDGKLDKVAAEKAREIINSLLIKGANINARKEKYGQITPILFCAVMNGNDRDIIELLLSKGAEVNAKNENGETALYAAAWSGDKNIVELLIAKGADINNKDKIGKTVLMSAVDAESSNKGIIELLISSGVNINDINNSGWTALMDAAYRGKKEIVELLVLKGADINLKNNSGKTAADLAQDPLSRVDKSIKNEITNFLHSKQKSL